MTLPGHVTAEAQTENSARQDSNLQVFNTSEVAAHYASLTYLSPCEKSLFDELLREGDAILDLGVGGGRTTTHLCRVASRYVGVDYAPKMVAACQQKFPRHEFLVANATDLAPLGDYAFDTVVMAFNGLDYLIPRESRLQGLAEIHRVLKNDGVLIFSSHNPRAIFARPAWNPERIEQVARGLAGPKEWMFEPLRFLLLGLRIVAALGQSGMESVRRFSRRVWRRAFWSGDGYMMDPAHGGLRTHYAVPGRMIAELEQCGFRFLRLKGDDYPRRSRTYVTDSYYYVFQKAGRAASSPCA